MTEGSNIPIPYDRWVDGSVGRRAGTRHSPHRRQLSVLCSHIDALECHGEAHRRGWRSHAAFCLSKCISNDVAISLQNGTRAKQPSLAVAPKDIIKSPIIPGSTARAKCQDRVPARSEILSLLDVHFGKQNAAKISHSLNLALAAQDDTLRRRQHWKTLLSWRLWGLPLVTAR